MPNIPVSKIALAADGSDVLQALLAQGAIHLDYLKVGPWMGQAHMQDCAETYPTLLHCNDSVIDAALDTSQILKLQAETASPWLSLHVSLPWQSLDALWQRLRIPVPLISRRRALQRAISNLKALLALSSVPIAIENQAHYQANAHDYLVDPSFITAIVQETGADFLLDVGHAKVSAHIWGTNVYWKALPLEKVIEWHVHRPGWHRGHLRDLHLPLSSDDFDFLRALLPHCPNLKAITLEYYGAASQLLEQLLGLKAMIDAYSAVPTTITSTLRGSLPRS